VTRHSGVRSSVFIMFAVAASVTQAQTPAQESPGSEAVSKSAQVDPSDVSGSWQVSWQGRLGTEQAVLRIYIHDDQLTGTLQSIHGISSVSGKLERERVILDVHFESSRPYTIRFSGTVKGGKIEGTSQAVGMPGSSAYMGHGGEIVQPEHPWSAKRAAEPGTEPSQAVPGPLKK